VSVYIVLRTLRIRYIQYTNCITKLLSLVTASRRVAVLQKDIGIDSNQTAGIDKIKYRRHQQVIE